MIAATATLRSNISVTAQLVSKEVGSCADATVEINGVEVGTVPSGGTDSFTVNLDGSPSGSWDGDSWEVTSPPCADATVQLNGVDMADIPSGDTENILVLQSDDMTQVGAKQGVHWRIADSDISVNGSPVGSVKAEDALDVDVLQDGLPVGSWNGSEWIVPSCPAGGGSISVAVSDASPSVGETITITATPSDFTPDSYLYFVYDGSSEITFIAEQASNTFDWTILGILGGNYTIYVLGVENGSPDVTAFGTVDITVTSAYLIDQPYGSNINACFSFIRRSALFNDYVAIIRRSSDNAQDSFKLSANDALDLTSENVAGTTTLGTWIGANNGFIVTWKDQAIGITATASNAADQAQIINNGIMITQNGVTSIFKTDFGRYVLNTPVVAESLFVIARNTNVTRSSQVPVGGNAVAVSWGGTVSVVTGIGMQTTSGSFYSNVEDTLIHLASVIPSQSLHVDGVLKGNTSLSPIQVEAIGGQTNAATVNMQGYISEVVLSSAAETANRSDIETNINNSYTPSIL